MSDWIVKNTETGETWEKDSRKEAEEAIEDFPNMPLELERSDTSNSRPETDGGPTVVEDNQTAQEPAQPAEPVPTDPAELSKDPIGFLEQVNTDFVNTIQGKPAISKQGFRFIQREFEISTESEVVEWSEDPLGCVVWAKAELDNGYSAEAHGEGYQFESGVSDNEFVRYADTRAKNRAISDLTSAGALAVSELQE